MNTQEIYAHTLDGHPSCDWEPLYGTGSHAERTAAEIAAFRVPFSETVCSSFHAGNLLRMLAISHDMGKASAAFQAYLQRGGGATVDHKTAAARWWCEHCPGVGNLLAYACHGHHGGLGQGARVFEQVRSASILPEVAAALPDVLREKVDKLPFLVGQGGVTDDEKLLALMMAVRMFHSCLVDADWLATEAFCDPEKRGRRTGSTRKSLSVLSAELETHISDREQHSSGKINELRKLVHGLCYEAAQEQPGVFSLNVPTGGGKSLSSLSFALKHAELHGMERVIYVIPYTSIIDQTSREFRRLFGEEQVVEHHSNICIAFFGLREECQLNEGNARISRRVSAESPRSTRHKKGHQMPAGGLSCFRWVSVRLTD